MRQLLTLITQNHITIPTSRDFSESTPSDAKTSRSETTQTPAYQRRIKGVIKRLQAINYLWISNRGREEKEEGERHQHGLLHDLDITKALSKANHNPQELDSQPGFWKKKENSLVFFSLMQFYSASKQKRPFKISPKFKLKIKFQISNPARQSNQFSSQVRMDKRPSDRG